MYCSTVRALGEYNIPLTWKTFHSTLQGSPIQFPLLKSLPNSCLFHEHIRHQWCDSPVISKPIEMCFKDHPKDYKKFHFNAEFLDLLGCETSVIPFLEASHSHHKYSQLWGDDPACTLYILIGTSLSEPHTSETALRKCVNVHTYVHACLLAAIYRKF